jgi:16S rRNA (guanine527-N7)-methyltransferase
MTLQQSLAAGVEALGLDLSSALQQKLLDYVALVEKWNRTYNLTAVREPEKMLSHHVFDSLAVVSHVDRRTIADVGSGAGLPGIPLAVALPHSHVMLVEGNQKKSAFLNQTVIELELTNVTVANTRVETWDSPDRFECVISRAFSDLGEFVSLAGGLCAADGVIAAMKGVYPHEELTQLPSGFRLREVVSLDVPGLGADRHLVLIERG